MCEIVQVYRGSNPELGKDAIPGVVKCLLGQLTNKDHAVYHDCFYISVPLAEELVKANTGLADTIMISTEGLPQTLKETKIGNGKQVFHQKKNVLVLK
jgi:hypothetical protein